ncbi:MAG: DUF4174 domain-containing protein [Phycisphaeraceae bacterium]
MLWASLAFACTPAGSAEKKAPPTQNQAMSDETDTIDLRMDDYAWSHRPLVVFAPTGDAPELVEQRNRLRDEQTGLKDRDMVVIEVIGREAGSVDDKPLSDAAVARLVERYDPAEDAFEVLLIGKDTGVKLRRTEPVATETLFALIDSMPMRQREMREGS